MHRTAFMLFLLIRIFVTDAAAEASVSITEFLATARKDSVISAMTGQLEYLRQEPGGLSFIEDAEFRMTIDKFENDRQKYAIRVKPGGWDEIQAEKEFRDTGIQFQEARLELLLHQALKQRYLTVVNARYVDEMIRLYQTLAALYEDRETVMKHYVNTNDFDAGDLAAAEHDRLRIQVDLVELKNQQGRIAEEIRRLSGKGRDASVDTDRLIGVEMIEDHIRRTKFYPEGGNIHLRHSASEAQAAEAEYQLEEAESRRLISFIEAAYNTEDQDEFDDAFSIEFGIRLPVGKGNRLNLQRRKLESMKSRSEHRALEREISSAVPVIRSELRRLIRQYHDLKSNRNQSFTARAFDQCLKNEGTDPLTLLKLKEGILKTDITLTKLSRMIFTKYLDFLDLSGRLTAKPLRNHLSENAEAI